MPHLKIGTRGSRLALWQAYYIQDLLQARGATTEIVIIETKGDQILDRSLSKIGSKGVFTEELEWQLRTGEIDLAVHSAKDVQSTLPDDLSLVAFTERENTADVLVSDKPWESPQVPLTIGTSSTRRVALLKRFYPHWNIVDMRGNLQTRLAKMRDGACDALLLAFAGVHRMGYNDLIRYTFPEFIPPVGQGSVAIEMSRNAPKDLIHFVREACNHPATETCLVTERAYLQRLEGGCSIPSFGHAQWIDQKLVFRGGLISLDGTQFLDQTITLQDPAEGPSQARQVADKILSEGGALILQSIRSQGIS
ncbi:MAG: hydroxymethylbilane synthase [Spirosomataceae bacterium]